MKNHLIFSLFVVSILTLCGCTVDSAGGQLPADAETPKSLAFGNLGHDSTADMVYVEGGTFQMGCDSSVYGDEKPVHTVTVNSFYISRYEITQAEWEAVMGTTVSDIIKETGWGSYGIGDNYPMYDVSWYDAVKYCNKRSEAEGLIPCYTISEEKTRENSEGDEYDVTCNWSANGYRLPTEAEWEYAARGGKHKSTYTYSGSDDIDEVAWYGEEWYEGSTHEVGKKKANALGLYDMSGNVWESCWDWYDSDYYKNSPANNPLGPASGGSRVSRGGGWNYWCGSVDDYRCAFRFPSDPSRGCCDVGFRVVRSAGQEDW